MTKRDTKRPERPPDLREPEVLWLELWQKMANAFEHWRRCELPQCRRAKTCTAAAVPIPCNKLFPRSPMSADEDARARAELKQAIEQRMAELLREEGMREVTTSTASFRGASKTRARNP